MIIPLLVVGGILLLVIIWFVMMYNGLVNSRNQVRNAWSQIDVQLKRRHDLIPNLVETVKGYAKHEKEVFENVTKARSACMSAVLAPSSLACLADIPTILPRAVAASRGAGPNRHKAQANWICSKPTMRSCGHGPSHKTTERVPRLRSRTVRLL